MTKIRGMGKTVFWFLTVVGAFLVFKISQIIISTLEMTDFVFGYLVGQIIVLMVVVVLATILGSRLFKR